MNTFTVAVLCIQACLVQNVFSQYLGAYDPGTGCGAGLTPATAAYTPSAVAFGASPFGYGGYSDLAYPAATSYAAPCGAGPVYGGAGEGNVAVAGQLPVAGTTAVAGQVPIMGAVSFNGAVPAAGAVSISGQCACGCGAGAPYY